MSENRQSIKRTNNAQFSKLVEVMEANPDIAKGVGTFGSSKKNQAQYWDSFALELNALGLPIREGKEWHKVWLDYKLKLKKKIATNKNDVVATGGGPFRQLTLSPLEQAVDNLLSLQQAVNPMGNTFGTNSTATVEQPDSNNADVEVEDAPMAMTSAQSTKINECRRSRGKFVDERVKLLQKQTETQEKLLVASDSIQKSLSEMARYSRKNYEVNKEHVEVLKAKEKRKERENLQKAQQHKDLLDLKIKKLECKLQYHPK
ncbi:uncharacterized protein LOC129948394 [Eupeodes corollae]|uniref:uncharacterized protein LOC129948394 n=1 Tax=Eupeodes corollae TaxID=290404 RepID=UPI002493AA0D|nr:uncharacterized protein LOC129948394 [Eupeodes corollae]